LDSKIQTQKTVL